MRTTMYKTKAVHAQQEMHCGMGKTAAVFIVLDVQVLVVVVVFASS